MTAPAQPQLAPTARRSRVRSAGGYLVLVLAGALLLLSSFAVWVDRVALDTDVFVETSTDLIEDDEIRRAVAQRAVDELYASVDVEAAIEDRLPNDVDSLAGLSAAGLRQVAPEILNRALGQPALQRLWRATVEQTHEELVDVLEGGGSTVSTEGGVVTLDLRALMLETADRIGIRSQVEDQVSEDAGRIELLRSDELDTAQDGVQLLETLAWLLPLITLAAFGLALWLASDRRVAVRGIGITVLVVGILGLVAASVTGSYLVGELVNESDVRPAADTAWATFTDLLRAAFGWMIALGVLFVAASWLAGSGQRARAIRRVLAPAVAVRPWAYAGLAVLLLILLVVVPVDNFRLLVVVCLAALGAAWIEVTRAQTRREFPGTSGSAILDDARTRISSSWQTLRSLPELRTLRSTSSGDLTARLATLADLHARGELTDEEYAAAKSRVLAGE
ncbi:MAG: SHOCT domain-containing protein [Actinobacteria bacterium]|nr:SHOCT domain-containing protein [Actinomycetota bacterium]